MVPFYWYGLSLITAWINNYILSKAWDEITHPFPNFGGCTCEVWEGMGYFIPYFIMDVIIYPWWDLRWMTLEMNGTQALTFSKRSLISQLKICGCSLLYSSTLRSTSGVATRGLLPPIFPGFTLPVSLYRWRWNKKLLDVADIAWSNQISLIRGLRINQGEDLLSTIVL